MERRYPPQRHMTTIVSPYRIALVILMAATVLVSCGRNDPHSAAPGSDRPELGPVWVLDPKDPGANLPPVGRSLFDYVVSETEGGKRIHHIPFPFTALVERLTQQLESEPGRSPLKRVLIPLNRSLQRNAARPQFFTFPRAVVGIDTEPAMHVEFSGMLLKDRFFLGYQEKANTIEVISYNEAAGRFEFQVVKDYKSGGTPRVLYANRAVCTVCHQNQGPIFARPLWDETNANPQIASLLEAQRRDFYGFPLHQGIDIPNAIDDATDRANELSAYQLLWQDGCERPRSSKDSIECRGDLVRFLLQYLLSGSRAFDSRSARYTNRLVHMYKKTWEEKWPQGLLISNPDILNRNPLDFFPQADGPTGPAQTITISADDQHDRSAIRSIFEPSVPRAPLATWSASTDTGSVHHAIAGLSRFIAGTDIRRVDEHLFLRGSEAGHRTRRYESVCRSSSRRGGGPPERLTLHCLPPQNMDGKTDMQDAGGFSMDAVVYVKAGKGVTGTIDRLSFDDGDDLTDLQISGRNALKGAATWKARLMVAHKQSGLHARRADGNAIKEVTIQVESPGDRSGEGSGAAILTVMDDFSPVHEAIDTMARATLAGTSDVLARKPFRRARVMEALYEHLEMPRLSWCCLDDHEMPPPLADADVTALDGPSSPTDDDQGTVPAIKSFRRYCAKCHQGEDPSPPNFLRGSGKQIQDQVNHCAERIYVRLDMWRLPRPIVQKPPCPPARRCRDSISPPNAGRRTQIWRG
ncbi:MAG: hypothetical protein H0W13_11165 [Nitrospirales bacterium]|nr:hypothetical protein [Nitrospirales bacterium]